MEQSDFMSLTRRGGDTLGRLEDDMRQNVLRSRPECDQLWPPAMPPQWLWLVLTEDLAAASGSAPMMPAMATANPANFDATANSGYGGYTIDTETTLMVIEATGQRSFSSGQWVLCRPQGTANSGAWEPVAAGVGLGSATLAATLAYNDAVALGNAAWRLDRRQCRQFLLRSGQQRNEVHPLPERCRRLAQRRALDSPALSAYAGLR